MATRNLKFSAVGTITDANGFPVEGVEVELLLVNLREEKPLGQVATNDAGAYRILYSLPAQRSVADLRIRVLNVRSQEVLGVSPVLYRASLETVINLSIPAQDASKSSLVQLINRIQPLIGSIKLADLREDKELYDISKLSAATGELPLRIARLSQAHRLEAATRIAAELHFAWMEVGLPEDPVQLAILPTEQLERALQFAAEQGLIEDRGTNAWKNAAAQLKSGNIAQPTGLLQAGNLFKAASEVGASEVKYVQRVLNQHLQRAILEHMPDVSPATVQIIEARLQGTSFQDVADLEIREVLERQIMPTLPRDGYTGPTLSHDDRCKIKNHAPYRAKVREVLYLDKPLYENPLLAESLRRAKTFAYAQTVGLSHAKTIAMAERGLMADEWSEDTLRIAVEERTLTSSEAQKLSRIGTLSRLVGNNPDLVHLLHRNAPENLAELVAYTPRDWHSLIERNQVLLPPGIAAETYAETLAQQVELAYPLPYYVHHRLQQEGEDSLLRKFHQNNPVGSWVAYDWIRSDGTAFKWTGIAQAERPAVIRQLAADQRIIRLAETPRQAVTLQKAGFDSARGIARQSPSSFIQSSGLDAQTAGRVYARAQEASTRALHAFAAVQDLVQGGLAQIKTGNIAKPAVAELLQIEGMSALFGPRQFCDCTECLSVLSPAAYLVDLLRFVEEKIAIPQEGEALPPEYISLKLLQRRPDLAQLPLNCDNSKTLIPYLTIVNEVLTAWIEQQENGDPFELAAQSGSSRGFLLPFNLPLAELRLYLSHFNLTPFDLYTTLHNPDQEVASLPAEAWPIFLNLDETDILLVTTPNDAAVQERYRINALSELSPELLIRMAGIERKDLSDLLEMRFNPDLKTLKIALEPNTEVDDVQAYREVFQGMSPAHADYLYRFIRLWRKTVWTIPQLDAILIALPSADTHITKPELLEQLSKAAWLQQQYRWSVPELCAFLDKMPVSNQYPQKPERPEAGGLLEQVFNLEAIFGLQPNGEYQEETIYPLAGDHAAHLRLSALLSGALKINDADLQAILEFLGGDWTGKLDHASLSLLYRHVHTARHFGWPVQEWLSAAALLGMKDTKGLSALVQLQDFSRWQQALGLLPSEMSFFLGKTIKLGGQAFEFRTPEWMDQLKEIANAEENYHTWPTKHKKWKTAFDEVILHISAQLNVGPKFWNALLEWTPEDIANYWAVDSTKNLSLDVLTKWSEEVERVLWLVQRLSWTEQAFIWLTENPGKAKIAKRRARNVATLKRLVGWQQLMPSNPETAAEVLKTLDAEGDAYVAWANHWKMETLAVVEMKNLLGLADQPKVQDIVRLQKALALGKRLDASAAILVQLGQYATYGQAKTAAEIALQLIQAQYPDEKERLVRVEPYTDKVNSWKRDVLVQYILTHYDGGAYPFEDESSLFAYFLLDVEMGGCFRTSRIVAAHGSIQLYIHRVLMNLEQSADGLFRVLEKIENLELFKTEWEWRKNYRVWEANRKVFLYPENYLEPDLRDNKTPIFRELEEELLQGEPSQERAELAWRNYFEQYTALADLRIAGSFYENGKNTYHFFGRSRKEPYQYYYRRWENQRLWTPWEAMELPISVKEVTGIVFNCQTHVFWAEIEEEEGKYSTFLNMSFLKANGRWSSPQRLTYSEGTPPPNTQIFVQISPGNNLLFDLSSKNGKILKSFDPIQNSLKTINTGTGLPAGTPLLMSNYNKIIDVEFCGLPMPFFLKYLNIQSTNKELTESEIDDVQDGIKAISESHIQLTQPISNEFLSVNHVGGTRNQTLLEIEKQKYLVKNVISPELSQGIPNPPMTTFALATTQTGLKRLREYFTLINIGHNPIKSYPVLLDKKGLVGFLDTPTQKEIESGFPLSITNPAYLSGPWLEKNHMDLKGSYGDYLRELFFHIPFHIAHQMNANQRFAEAKWWYERIFDPSASGDMSDIDRPWRYIEFKELGYAKMKETLQDSAVLERYRLDPFNPHAIARLRLSAYQKTIVMKYVDNLVDWGDQLFAQNTMESTNEALMLYQLASDVLGDRPIKMGACTEPDTDPMTYDKISKGGDTTWDAVLIGLENLPGQDDASADIPPGNTSNPQSQLQTLIFCIPVNADLHEYWDRVADRLYKIRHCLDINGQRRQIPLFAPPIDPMLLVRAKAMGLTLEQALSLAQDSVPHYRFTHLIERAKQYTQMVQSFGSALLSALNSKDVEQLTLLRSVQEREILRMGREVRKRNLEEAKAQLKGAIETRNNTQMRFDYFDALMSEGLIPWEDWQEIAQHSANASSVAESTFRLIAAGWPFNNPGKKSEDIADFFRSLGSGFNAISSSFGMRAGFQRRKQDWQFQRDTASQEIKQLAQQLLAAEIGVAIAEKDLDIHERSMEHADEVYAFYRDKFTNLGLYNFMSRTLSTLHRQAYTIAYEATLQAQKALEYEKEKVDIVSNTWEGDRAGLLSGERLMLQIQQLERAYEKLNTRDLELSKHISLQQLNPLALLQLRETGKCDFAIPEELFDLDFPGHYFRRNKSVSITIPCIAGPYTTINATLRLKTSSVRIKNSLAPASLVDYSASIQSIATSSAQNDGGLFELNFRDERYLPFEGTGVISEWTLEMMYYEEKGTKEDKDTAKSLRQFDYNTIADVIIHLRYTASEGGVPFRKDVISDLKTKLNTLSIISDKTGLYCIFSLRYDFPNEWHAWTTKPNQDLGIQLKKHHFPYFAQMSEQLSIKSISSYEKGKTEASAPSFTIDNNWLITASDGDEAKQVEDWFILVHYSI